MIGQLNGTLIGKQPPQLVIDVHGVGYEVDAPMSTFYQLPDIGQKVILHTHFLVREDAQQLYGFYTLAERLLFRSLLKVNGVGPRLALTILSSKTTNEFVAHIVNNDTISLVRIPGIGKKTAERLVIEMRDKLSDWQEQPAFDEMSKPEKPHRYQILQDAISALITLGYKAQEANRVVTKIDDGDATSELLIRRALKEMM